MNSPLQILPPVRLAFLDGLRALAALWVMFGHIHLFTYGWASHDFILNWPLNLLLYMHLGVDVFLVLSGYCLALQAVGNGSQLRDGFLPYLKARARRILPPYFVSLALILAVNALVPLVAWGRASAGMTGDIAPSVLLANMLLLQDLFPQLNTINGPYWSVATEWHLYFLFPLALWLLRRHGPLMLAAVAGSAALLLTWVSLRSPFMIDSLAMAWPQPPYFVFLFVFGMLAAWFTHGAGAAARLRQSGPTLLLVGLLSFTALAAMLEYFAIVDLASAQRFQGELHWIDPLTGILAAVLIVALARLPARNLVIRLLASRALQSVGGYSYSLYLLHIPVLAALLKLLLANWPDMHVHFQFAIMATGGAAVVMAASKLFAALFERGGWRTVHRWRPGARFIARIEELERENSHLRAALQDARMRY